MNSPNTKTAGERRPLLSIVSPVYAAAPIVDELVTRVSAAVTKITPDFEIILVEDGSPDHSWQEIQKACRREPRVKGLKLSRNFGQHNALSAGLEHARGEYIVVMDCDLQDNPDYIPALYQEAMKGFDIVYTRQNARRHAWFKNLTASLYYRALSWLSSYKIDREIGRIGSYSMINRKVLEAFLRFHDYRRAYLMALQWLGFSSTVVAIVHEKRFAGKSSYTFSALLVHALNYTISYSDRVLYWTVYTGAFFSLTAFAGILFLVYRYFTFGGLQGWSSTMVTIMFFGGMLLTAVGVIGVYIAKIFEQTKNRPRYFLSETVNL